MTELSSPEIEHPEATLWLLLANAIQDRVNKDGEDVVIGDLERERGKVEERVVYLKPPDGSDSEQLILSVVKQKQSIYYKPGVFVRIQSNVLIPSLCDGQTKVRMNIFDRDFGLDTAANDPIANERALIFNSPKNTFKVINAINTWDTTQS